MKIMDLLKNYRTKKSLKEENQRLINENKELRKIQKPMFNPPVFNAVRFDIQEFMACQNFSHCEYMNLNRECRKEIVAKEFVDVLKEYMEIEEQVSPDKYGITVIAKLNLAIKK